MNARGWWLVVALVLSLGALVLRSVSGREHTGQSGEIRLELWTLALRPFFDDYVQERLAAFEAAHTGVRVAWTDVPFDALDRKLIAAASAGRAPDLVNFSDKNYARFVALGAAEPLDGLLPGDPDARYVPGALRLGRIGGHLLALPWYLTTQTVLANAELLAKGGLTPETVGHTWREILPQAKAFHEKTGAALVSVPLGTESDFMMMLFAEGLPPLVPGPGGRLKADLTRPEVVAYMQMWVDVFRSGAIPREAVTGGSAHLSELYQNSRVAVINSGPNFLKRIRDIAPKVFEATVTLPPITGSLGRAHIAVMLLCVTSTSPHPEEAAALAWHLTSAESQEALCKRAVILPSTASSLDHPMFAMPRLGSGEQPAGDAKVAMAQAVTAEALKKAVAYTPALEAWPDMRRAFEERIKRVLLEGADLETNLRLIEADWQRLLDASGGAPVDAAPGLAKAIAKSEHRTSNSTQRP